MPEGMSFYAYEGRFGVGARPEGRLVRELKKAPKIELWFHSHHEEMEGRPIKEQGVVLRVLEGNKFVVLLFSFGDGTPSDEKVVSLAEMSGWDFYPNGRAMRMAYYKSLGHNPKECEEDERCNELMAAGGESKRNVHQEGEAEELSSPHRHAH
jgi:hypothetical protein